MKKYLIFILPVLVLLFGNISYAYSQDDLTKLNTVFNQKYGRGISTSCGSQILNKWEEVKATKPYGYIMTNNSTDFFSVFSSSQISLNSSSVNVSGELISNWFYSDSTNRTLSWSQASATYNGTVCLSLGSWSDFHVVPIEWDTPLYSANIGAPRYDVTYRELSSTPIVDVPLDVSLTFPPSTVYIEMDAIFDIPVDIYAGSYQGNYEYNVEDTVSTLQHIINKEDMVLASNASTSYIHLALVDAWEDIYNDIPISEINWRWPSDYSASLKSSIQARYENLRKICCFYGNEVKIFVRYFTIANETQFVVGSWRIWDSTSPNKFTDQMPTWYEPYIPASGTTGISSNTGSNTQQDPNVITIPNGSGDPTGIYYNPTTNITVGSNVPNYPDYPTIRSYNADNFLVQTMNYLDYFNDPDTEHDLFGEFGGFLKTVFVFIPGEIWSIIAVGFCLVIVVMFLKIL